MPYLKKAEISPEPLDCRILSAALELFVEQGFHNVSVHDIQREAGVSIGSIYNHFAGKEGVARELYQHLLAEFEEMIDDVIAENLSNRQRCNKIIALLFEYTETRRTIVAFMLHAKHREFLPGEPPVCSAAPFKAMRDIVEWGMAEGEINRADTWIMTSCVFGSAIRMIHLRLDGLIEQPLPSFYEELVENVWRGIVPPEQKRVLKVG